MTRGKPELPGAADVDAVRRKVTEIEAEIQREAHARAAKPEALARMRAELATRRASYAADLNIRWSIRRGAGCGKPDLRGR